MSLEERAKISNKAAELRRQGKFDEAMEVSKTRPISPFLAKIIKEKVGAEWLRSSGWNLAEAEAEFGRNWLDK